MIIAVPAIYVKANKGVSEIGEEESNPTCQPLHTNEFPRGRTMRMRPRIVVAGEPRACGA